MTARRGINTQAYEDTQGWRESAAPRLTAARGRRGKGQRRTRRAAAAKGRRTVAWRRVGGSVRGSEGGCVHSTECLLGLKQSETHHYQAKGVLGQTGSSAPTSTTI